MKNTYKISYRQQKKRAAFEDILIQRPANLQYLISKEDYLILARRTLKSIADISSLSYTLSLGHGLLPTTQATFASIKLVQETRKNYLLPYKLIQADAEFYPKHRMLTDTAMVDNIERLDQTEDILYEQFQGKLLHDDILKPAIELAVRYYWGFHLIDNFMNTLEANNTRELISNFWRDALHLTDPQIILEFAKSRKMEHVFITVRDLVVLVNDSEHMPADTLPDETLYFLIDILDAVYDRRHTIDHDAAMVEQPFSTLVSQLKEEGKDAFTEIAVLNGMPRHFNRAIVQMISRSRN